MAGILDFIDQKLGTRLGLLMSDPRAAIEQMNQQAGAYNQASLLATQAERNALRGLPVTPEQAAAKQYVDKSLEDVAMGFAGTTTGKISPEYLGKHLEFHFSVEPNLSPNKYFSEQKRTVSKAGERGGTGEIYTTRSPQFWDSQFAYEKSGKIPKHVYLVEVKNPTPFDPLGSIGHQSISKPEDVKVLTKLGESKKNELFDAGLFEWLAEKYSKQQFGVKPDWFAANKK
jgi:hypothetical protein